MAYLTETVKLGLRDLALHKLRSFLTALGIILGVAAVITMVSLGEGSKQEALAQIERLGARNIILRSQKPPQSNTSGSQRSFLLRYGLTRADLEVIEHNLTDAELIVPVKSVGGEVQRGAERQTSQAFGTTPELREVANISVRAGRYLTEADMEEDKLVCVIGSEVAKQFFPFDNPIGETIRIDETTLRVIGVLAPVGLSGGAGAALIGRDLNLDVHLPITTARAVFGDTVRRTSSGNFETSEIQISEIYVMAPSRDRVLTDAERLKRIIQVRHGPAMPEVGMIVPYELLENARKSALTWNLVLGAIAGISLLVGGIGIMNIMLATVTERTREIGIRRALGAQRNDIVQQFLVETGVLSAIGGLAGVALGLGASVSIGMLVPHLPRLPIIGGLFPPDVSLPTQVTMWSILLAFGVATATGLLFGVYPALKASRQDPIVALRHD